MTKSKLLIIFINLEFKGTVSVYLIVMISFDCN